MSNESNSGMANHFYPSENYFPIRSCYSIYTFKIKFQSEIMLDVNGLQ